MFAVRLARDVCGYMLLSTSVQWGIRPARMVAFKTAVSTGWVLSERRRRFPHVLQDDDARRAGRWADALLWERWYAPGWVVLASIAGGGVTSSGARLPR